MICKDLITQYPEDFQGVIRCQDLGPCTDDEILDNLKSESVMHVRNIQVRRNGVLKRTNVCSDILSFSKPLLQFPMIAQGQLSG